MTELMTDERLRQCREEAEYAHEKLDCASEMGGWAEVRRKVRDCVQEIEYHRRKHRGGIVVPDRKYAKLRRVVETVRIYLCDPPTRVTDWSESTEEMREALRSLDEEK